MIINMKLKGVLSKGLNIALVPIIALQFSFAQPLFAQSNRQSALEEKCVSGKSDNIFCRLKDDFTYMLKKPLNMKASDWKTLGVAAGAVGLAAAYDGKVKKASQKNHLDFFENFEILGNAGFDLGIFAGLYGLGKITKEDKHKETALLGIESLACSGALSSLIKYSTGRKRPDSEGDSWFGGGNSFPSGHTTSAFATARILDHQYLYINEEDTTFQKAFKYAGKAAVYGLASAVGYQRLNKNQHYLSDVVAGAIIGTLTSNMIINLNKKKDGWKLKPEANNGLIGFSLVKNFD
jgi:membrane-associated phospholipid phosphatase